MTNPILPLLLALAVVPAQTAAAQEVEGLREGESVTRLAPGPGPSTDYTYGRVVDAFTGKPLAGATVELWSEEIDVNYGGFHRFGVATSGRDGRFLVREREGSNQAEKLRVSAPGYLTFTEARGALFDTIVLFPAEAKAPRLRIVDLQGRPIQGARVTSTFTCAHDIPAFEYTSDVDGLVVLKGYGLQDSIPELRVLAPGFAGIKYLDESAVSFDEWLRVPIGDGSLRPPSVIRLRRTSGAEIRLLDENGATLANTAILVQDGDGHHVLRTDGEGNAFIPARYDSGELAITRLSPDPGPGAYGLASTQGRTTFRLNGTEWPEETPVGRVRFVWSGDGGRAPIEGLQISHTEGWVDWTDADGWAELPAGAAYIVVDEMATEAPRSVPPVFVTADQTALVELQRTPRRDLGTLPAGLVSRVIVEVGASSIEYTPEESVALSISIPDGEPYSIWFPSEPMAFSSGQDAGPFPLGALGSAVQTLKHRRRLMKELEDRPFEWRIETPAGLGVGIFGPHSHDMELQADADSVTITGQVGPLLLRFTRDGHADRWMRAHFALWEDAPVVPELSQLASLTFEAPAGFAVEGFDDTADLAALHPGPFDCVVRLADGRRIGLALELAPGEERVLRIAD